jgi:nanoRNase/pAp phosphatase (c-di-AMP/oligoRNAs hydrolase)
LAIILPPEHPSSASEWAFGVPILDDTLSLTKDLANEMLHRHKDKVIVLGREKSGEVRCSLRSGPQKPILPALQRALLGIQGYGGGHEHAVGCAVKKEDFERFLSNLRKELQS